MLFGALTVFAGGKKENPTDAQRESVLNYIKTTIDNPAVTSVGGEWAVIALARSGGADSEWINKFLANVPAAINSFEYATDWECITLALTAAGVNATDCNGRDFTAEFKDYSSLVSDWTVNAGIYGLLALDSGNYPGDRDKFVEAILSEQLENGGWTFMGTDADPDLTAMAVQALAPYRESNEKVKTAVEKALNALKALQDKTNGGFSSWGQLNAGSTAQVIIALSAVQIDAAEWTVNGADSPITALLEFYDEATGGFRFFSDGEVDQMGTEQAALALIAYNRYINGQNPLYIMGEEKTTADNNSAMTAVITACAAVAVSAAVFALIRKKKKRA